MLINKDKLKNIYISVLAVHWNKSCDLCHEKHGDS